MQYFVFVRAEEEFLDCEIDATFETIKEAREYWNCAQSQKLVADKIKCFLFEGEKDLIWFAFADFEKMIFDCRFASTTRLEKIAARHGVEITKNWEGL